ncbi:MAG: hypothetical protein KDI60_13365 [Xanthomonadales bacterium]|nr:hypothetical protein [Xanthomonadales bacterium]
MITQVADTILPMFGAPDWVARTIVILLAIGFIPALVISWVFELTPEGLKRDSEAARGRWLSSVVADLRSRCRRPDRDSAGPCTADRDGPV